MIKTILDEDDTMVEEQICQGMRSNNSASKDVQRSQPSPTPSVPRALSPTIAKIRRLSCLFAHSAACSPVPPPFPKFTRPSLLFPGSPDCSPRFPSCSPGPPTGSPAKVCRSPERFPVCSSTGLCSLTKYPFQPSKLHLLQSKFSDYNGKFPGLWPQLYPNQAKNRRHLYDGN
jgi:hypothetical protein